MTRAEILTLAHELAEPYLERDKPKQAFLVFVIELCNHEETKGNMAIRLGLLELVHGKLATVDEMRAFLHDFH